MPRSLGAAVAPVERRGFDLRGGSFQDRLPLKLLPNPIEGYAAASPSKITRLSRADGLRTYRDPHCRPPVGVTVSRAAGVIGWAIRSLRMGGSPGGQMVPAFGIVDRPTAESGRCPHTMLSFRRTVVLSISPLTAQGL